MTKYVEDCEALRATINSVQRYCVENCMELIIQKIKITYFKLKTNNVNFNYSFSNVLLLCSDCTIDLGVTLDRKLCRHCHVDFVYSRALSTLRLIRYITYFLFLR